MTLNLSLDDEEEEKLGKMKNILLFLDFGMSLSIRAKRIGDEEWGKGFRGLKNWSWKGSRTSVLKIFESYPFLIKGVFSKRLQVSLLDDTLKVCEYWTTNKKGKIL